MYTLGQIFMDENGRGRVGLLGLALLLAGGVAGAQTPDTSQWHCALCPFAQGATLDYSAGASYVSDDAARFGDANGYHEQGGYALAEAAGQSIGANGRLVWRAEDLGLAARSLSLAGSRADTLDYRLSYSELPHYVFDTTHTVFRAGAGNTLLLPAGWVRAPSQSGMSALASSLVREDIASERDIFAAGMRVRPRLPLELYADYSRQSRSGTALSAAPFFSTTSELARPIDQHTDEVALGLRYRVARGTLDLGYRASFFDNRALALTWEDPFASAPGAERGALAESPDNSFQGLSLGGAFNLLERTAVTFAAGIGRGEQNEPLLPYTINTAPSASALPRSSLEGAIDTSHLALTVSSRPWSRTRIAAAYRYDERDNTTPSALWNRVIVDSFNSAESEPNVAYDFSRSRLNVVADTDVSRALRVSAGYDRTMLDRNLQEVSGQVENAGWGRVRWRIASGLELKVRSGSSRRDVDRYDTALAIALEQNPLLAKYNLAYRYRSYTDATLTRVGVSRPYTFALSALHADDEYTQSLLGLANDQNRRLAVDFGWTFSPRAALYASASDEQIDAWQRGSESFAAPDWNARHANRFRTFAGGVQLTQIVERLDLSVDLSRAEGRTRIDIFSASGSSNGPLPALRSERDALRVKARYQRSAALGILLELRYERLATADWALADVAPDTVPGLLSLGADPYRYNVFVLGAGITYRWASAGR